MGVALPRPSTKQQLLPSLALQVADFRPRPVLIAPPAATGPPRLALVDDIFPTPLLAEGLARNIMLADVNIFADTDFGTNW